MTADRCGETAFWIAGSCQLPAGHFGKHDSGRIDPYADSPDLPRDEIARRLRERSHDWKNDPDEQAGTHGSPHDACMTAELIIQDAYMTDETPEGIELMLERLEAASIALSLAQHRAALMLPAGAFYCERCAQTRHDDSCALPPTGQHCPQPRER